MGKPTVMIFGLGELGGYVLEFLARTPNMAKIVTVDVREDWGLRKTNGAIIGAAQANFYPEIEFRQGDIFDVEKTAALIKEVQPTIVYNAMSLQSWWVITTLPPDVYKVIDEARFGPWYPMHFVPAYKLMQAIKKAGVQCHVVNSAFPDLVNVVLGKLGMAPTVGIGNIDNMLCQSRNTIAKMLNVPMRSVTVYLAVPHFVSYYAARYGDTAGANFYMKVMVDDKEVKLDRKEFLTKLLAVGRRPGGTAANPVVASSSCRIIVGILNDTHELGHAPGPNGLPGGYPITLSAAGVEVFVPQGTSLQELININEQGQKFDGVERVEADGTVVITEKSAETFKRVLGVECRTYKVSETEFKAKELDEKFKAWAKAQTGK